MSKYVKIYRFDDFDAPVVSGDRFGYLTNLLRIVGTTGYNEKTDIVSVEINSNKITLTYTDPHQYKMGQILKLDGFTSLPINNEYRVHKIINDTQLVLSVLDEIIHPDSSVQMVINVSSIVSPLGIKEKFRDGDRSVFTLDEDPEECFLYVDDRTPANWPLYGNVTPLVFMTNSMSDIDTVDGRYIMPYDSNNPSRYKEHDYLDGSNNRNGLWVWPMYYQISSGLNNATASKYKSRWTIIGNGRFFFIFINGTDNRSFNANNTAVLYFGRYKKESHLLKHYPYLLKGISNTSNIYRHANLPAGHLSYFTPSILIYSDAITVDTGKNYTGILSNYNGAKTSNVRFAPISDISLYTSVINSALTSSNNGVFPSIDTNKHILNRLYIFDDMNVKVGVAPGTMSTSQTSYANEILVSIKCDNKDILLYNIIMTLNQNVTGASGTTNNVPHVISLSYDDWGNYD